MKFGRALREVVRFEVLYKLFVLCLVNPAMREIYQTYVSSVGVSFNAQMLGTFLNLKGGLLFLALFFLSALLVFYELSVVVNIVALCREGTPFRLRTVLKASVWNLGAMRGPGIIPAALYYVLFLPHVRLGYVNTLVPSVTIPEFIFDAMRRTPPLGQIGMILYNVLVYAAFLLLLFVPVRMVLRRERFGAAVRGGLSCWKQLGALGAAQVIAVLFIWNQGMTEIARFWRRNPLENSDFDGNFLKFLVYSEAFRKDLVYWVLMAVLLSAGMAAFLYVVLRRLSDKAGLHPTLYPDWQGDGGVLLAIAVHRLKGLAARVRAAFKKKRWKAAAGAAGLLFAAYLVLGLWQPPLVHALLSIGHRGCNLEIENTVEAVLAADADGMDYAEIDVQLTADGVPVIFHDTALSRLSDASGNVSDYAWDELQAVELRDEYSYPGKTARIPSLEEMLRAVQDAPNGIGLLIELKGDTLRQEQLAAAVTALVEQYDFGSRAMFMSLDYYSVLSIHAAHPEWWVGYCVFGSAGDIDDSIWRYDIDFLAVEESMVTNRLVTQARGYGLPVYVWSVNDDEKTLQCMEMGVVGLISDWTDTAATVEAYEAAHSGVEYAGRDEVPAQDTARLQ